MFIPVTESLVLLSRNVIQKDPGKIVSPIANFLGYILNIIFNFVQNFGVANSLGISIILLTIVAKIIMLPLGIQQQKSMMNMQKVQPEMEKIKKKYANKKDTESQQKMNAEIQRLYAEHKVNPLFGCLPLFIQMPIFFALSFIMQQSFRYINVLGDIYYKSTNSLAQLIISVENYESFAKTVLQPLIAPKLPKNLYLDVVKPEDLAKALNKFSATDWQQLLSAVPESTKTALELLIAQKQEIELFFGIDLVEKSVNFSGSFAEIMSHMWPGILIPLFAGITTFLSSYVMNKQNKSTDPNMLMQQKMMLIMMPIMMGFMTAGFPAGVGLYWITSNVFQMGQQYILNKVYLSEKKEAKVDSSNKALSKSEKK